MRVVSLNANGIRAALKKGLAEYLKGVDADIICLQELKASPEVLPQELYGLGYHVQVHCAAKKGYSGVAVLSKQAPNGCYIGLGEERFDSEGRVLHVAIGELSVLSVYVPSGSSGGPRQAVKKAFLECFASHVEALLQQGRVLLLCGDFNIAHQRIDLKNWRGNQKTSGFLPEEREWFSQLLGLGLKDVVREQLGPEEALYSWWSLRSGARDRDVGWRLDYQLASLELANKVGDIAIPRQPIFSDHAPVVVDYDVDYSS